MNTLFTDGGFDTWLADLASTDLDTFRCIARVPRDADLFGIEAGMINVNGNGLKFFDENFDFSQFFNLDFTVGFADFDLANLATLDLAGFDFDAFNAVLQPYFSAFEVFNLLGVFNFDFAAVDATNIATFSLDNIAK